MLTRFEHFAMTEMMGAPDTPPRSNGRLCFSKKWERTAFGVALALAKEGHFDWETFRQNLIVAIGEWERAHDLGDGSWNYYDQWQLALERAAIDAGLIQPDELEAKVLGEGAACA